MIQLPKKTFLSVILLAATLIFPFSLNAETLDVSQAVQKNDNSYTVTLKEGGTLKITVSKDVTDLRTCDFKLLSDGIIQEISEKDYFEISQPTLQLKDKSFSFLGLKTGQTVLLLLKRGTLQNGDGNSISTDSAYPIEDVVTFIVNVVER